MSTAALWRALQGGFALAVVVATAACGTPPPSDFGGDWRPVNRFHDEPSAIPLQPAYAFHATPIDETLKKMLERWAADSGLKLSYRLDVDYTLHTPVARIRTSDLSAATSELTDLYAAQGVSISADGEQIVVQPACEAVTC